MPEQNILVEYLGNKPVKKDNVLFSGAIWNGNSDIQELPLSVGSSLIRQHPKVWCECTDKNAVASPKEDITSEIDVVIAKLEEMGDVKKVRKYLKEEFDLTFTGNPKLPTILSKAREHMSLLADKSVLDEKSEQENKESEDNSFNGVEITPELQPLLAIAQAGNFSNDPEEAVSQAIDMLGGVDEGFYNVETGMPKLEAVQLLVGQNVGTDERIEIAMANRTDS